MWVASEQQRLRKREPKADGRQPTTDDDGGSVAMLQRIHSRANSKSEFIKRHLLFAYFLLAMLSSQCLPTIKGKELPPPQKDSYYSNIEVVQFALVYKKSSVITAIHKSSFRPKRGMLYEYFPSKDEAFSSETVKLLLSQYEVGSDEWKKTVNLIATNAEHSVCEENIYKMLGMPSDSRSLHECDDQIDDELDEINPTDNALMAASPESTLRCISPDVEMVSADDSNTDRSKKRKANSADPIRSHRCTCIKDALQILKEELESNGSSSEMKSLARKMLMNGSDRSKQTSKSAVRAATASIIAPRFCFEGDLDKARWSLTEEVYSASSKTNDVKNLRASLITTTKANAQRAAAVLHQFLKDQCNDLVMIEFDKLRSMKSQCADDPTLPEIITDSIKRSIDHHTTTRGTRTIVAETFVKNVAISCVFGLPENENKVSYKAINKLTGLSMNQLKQARESVNTMLTTNSQVIPLSRKQRNDCIRGVAEQYIWLYLQDDDYTRLDTNKKLMKSIDPRTGEEVDIHGRIWKIELMDSQWKAFLESKYYSDFQQDHHGRTIGYRIFSEVIKKVGKFVTKPTMESCVDELVSDMKHKMNAMHSVLRRKDVKDELEGFVPTNDGATYEQFSDILHTGGAFELVDLVCCQKVEEKPLHFDKSKECPTFIPLKCTHGVNGDPNNRCPCCGVNKKLAILNAKCRARQQYIK